ncbi:MAG: adenylate/guanylate cyclase domain-containing protein, partial [Candidatus Afipia apatlaquensis]|nr:adenylate/guanylate cyclase domain-containing protein [Candidatus Afipia apatlaquensis]
MTDFNSLYATLKQTADPKVADAIQTLVETGADHELNRINLIEFAARTGLAEEKVISGFLHASQIGIFDLTWNVLCPGCSGVLGAHDTLKQLQPEDYHCGLCAAGYQASIDDQVEVAFTVSPRVRRIAAHDPHTLPSWDYWRQIFWSSGIDINEDSFGRLVNEATLEAVELAPGEKAVLSLQLPA